MDDLLFGDGMFAAFNKIDLSVLFLSSIVLVSFPPLAGFLDKSETFSALGITEERVLLFKSEACFRVMGDVFCDERTRLPASVGVFLVFLITTTGDDCVVAISSVVVVSDFQPMDSPILQRTEIILRRNRARRFLLNGLFFNSSL